MASPNLDEIVSTTLRYRAGEAADNLLGNIELLSRLREKGNTKMVDGGRSIVQELIYDGNNTFKWYSGNETLNVDATEVISAAEYDWKQAAVAINMSGLDQIRNSGKHAIINLLSTRVKAAEKTMLNNLSTGVYSNGTASGGKQIGGLQLLVSDDGTGTVGNIISGTWTFWQNYFYDFSVQGVTPGPTTIQQAMNTCHLNTKRGRDMIDLWVADSTYYNYFWQSLQAIQRITDSKKADSGYRALEFMGADVVPDGGLGGDAPASHMYGLNTDYLHFYTHPDRNIVALKDRYAVNQDAFARILAWAGNMGVSNRSLQSVIVA